MRLRRQPYCQFFATIRRRSGSSLLWPVMTTSLLVYSVTVVTAVAANLNTNSDDIGSSGLIIGGSTTSLTTDEDQQQQELQQSTLQAFDTTVTPQLLNESSSLNAAANSNFYPSRKERPPKTEEELILKMPQAPLGTTASGSPVKPTKYHYYPHNQHIYLLPECAVQQVCNAVYVRLNYTQPLCACPSRYREPCSASLNSDDLHTTELSTDPKSKVLTLVKTCEPVSEMRLCRNPRDWSLLALQNVRTGKSHYLVICRCPDSSTLEGPMSHDQPTYASVPGIKVYGMVCISKSSTSTVSTTNATKRKARPMRQSRSNYYHSDLIFPWNRVEELIKYVI